MRIELSEGVICLLILTVICTGILSGIWMYHQHKEVEINYYIPAEHKAAADAMWKHVYTTMEKDGYRYAYNRATEAINATYGVPFVIKNDKVKIPAQFVPPELPELPENTDTKDTKDFKEF